MFAATMESTPGGRIADPVVRQVDIARPAVVRIITKLGARLTVQFTPTSQRVTFPRGGGSYLLELSGSGAFISAHGDILTADHVVNPPHDLSIITAIYQTAAADIADYINTRVRSNQPSNSADVVAALEAGIFPSTVTFDQPSSEVYLSTAYAASALTGTKLADVPAQFHAAVDRIEAQSSFEAMDVALIHVSGMDDMPSIPLDDSSQVAEQDNLTVIGFPGLADESRAPVNLLTSSINRVYVSAIKTTDEQAPLIQVGGNIEHGDSGGPALDASGHIVGIVSFGLFDSNETGATSFLQAANSARTLIQSQGINTAPGLLQRNWAQAFADYASTALGHWHKAFQELQKLVDTHPNFLGVTPYLAYAQSQARTEQFPSTSSTSSTMGLIIVLSLLGVLIACGIVIFVAMRRRTQVTLVGPAQGVRMGASVPAQANYRPLPFPVQDDVTVVGTHSSSPPTWAPLPQTPQPSMQIDPGYLAMPFLEKSAQLESVTVEQTDASQLVGPEFPAYEAQSMVALPTSAVRKFAIPKRPVVASQEGPVYSPSGRHTWVAPCGHANAPEVRFCRVCGQIIQQVRRTQTDE